METNLPRGLQSLVYLLQDAERKVLDGEVKLSTLTSLYVTVQEDDPEAARATVALLLDRLSNVKMAVTPGVGPYEFRAEGNLSGLGVVVLADAAVVCEQAGMVPVEVLQPLYVFNGESIPVAR